MDVVIEVRPLDADAFAPFGWLPVDEGDEADEGQQLAFEWGDAHLDFIAHTPDELVRVPEGAVVERLYRHRTHTQALMPVNTDAVLVVAPASSSCSVDSLRAFLLHPLDVFVLHRGTWHWGPFPVADQPVRLLNLQGRRYQEDSDSMAPGDRVVVRLPDY